MNSKVVEYLGLPATGKSWQLKENGFCKYRNAVPHSVPLGGGSEKRKNTIIGFFHNYKFSITLSRIAVCVLLNEKDKFLLRPFLVILERYGRIINLKKKDKEIHIDEGVFQFIWRVFSELSVTKKNKYLLKKCISYLKKEEHSIAYISTPKQKHISQVISRKKINSNFDAGIINGNKEAYILGRYWMAIVIEEIRKNDYELVFIWNH